MAKFEENFDEQQGTQAKFQACPSETLIDHQYAKLCQQTKKTKPKYFYYNSYDGNFTVNCLCKIMGTDINFESVVSFNAPKLWAINFIL